VQETPWQTANRSLVSLVIETHHLTKTYRTRSCRDFVAVDDLNLSVGQGKVFGFLGPNGAGKTTTINMLLGISFPTNGNASVLGRPLGDQQARRKIGFLPEKFQFHDFLTAVEFLHLHGALYGMPERQRKARIPEVLQLVGLSDRANDRIRGFSKGMQQRVGLAQAIIADPDLVILDEPTSALDPLGRRDVRDIIAHLKDEGKSVLLNSHLLSEIEMTCDEVAIVKAGKVIRQGKIEDLLATPTEVTLRLADRSTAVLDAIGKVAPSIQLPKDPNDPRFTVMVSDENAVAEVAAAVVHAGGKLLELTPRRESLEELFVRVIEGK
jgi:ABC-2 type transport system ATP-binding protein